MVDRSLTRRGSTIVETGLNRRPSRRDVVLTSVEGAGGMNSHESMSLLVNPVGVSLITTTITTHIWYARALGSILLLSLIIDDFRILFGDRSVDTGVDITLLIIAILLASDVVLGSLSRPLYILSLSWFIDLLGSVCVLLDCVGVTGGIGGRYANISSTGAVRILIALNVLGKGFRLIHLVRLMGIRRRICSFIHRFRSTTRNQTFRRGMSKQVTLSPGSQMQLSRFFGEDNGFLEEMGIDNQSPMLSEMKEELRVDKLMQERSVIKVGLIVVVTVVVSMVLFPPVYGDGTESGDLAVQGVVDTSAAGYIQWVEFGEDFRLNYEQSLVDGLSDVRWIIFTLKQAGVPDYPQITTADTSSLSGHVQTIISSDWRKNELCGDSAHWVDLVGDECFTSRRSMEVFSEESAGDAAVMISLYVDIRDEVVRSAWMNLVLLVLMWIFIDFFAWLSIRTVDRYLLQPLARMIRKVRAIQANPLCGTHSKRGETTSDPMALVEAALVHRATLLKVSFGEAGARIIAGAFIEGSEETSLGSEGAIVEGVFGFFGIFDFDALTEIFGAKMVVLVNRVAEIVHGVVEEFGGFVTSNRGNGFFVVWKFDEKMDEFETEKIAELAVVCAAEIIAAIHKSPIIRAYSDHPKLVAKKMTVRLSVALHHGEAIEGAIGTVDYKLDPTYLGKDTVVPGVLQQLGGTVYHRALIVSGALVRRTSDDFQRNVFREIDVRDDLGVFVVDLDEESLSQYHAPGASSPEELKREKTHRKLAKLVLGTYNCVEAFSKHELGEMRTKFTTHHGLIFQQLFRKAYLNYRCGEWAIAQDTLMQTLTFWRNHPSRRERANLRPEDLNPVDTLHVSPNDYGIDGPSLALLSFIREGRAIATNSHT